MDAVLSIDTSNLEHMRRVKRGGENKILLPEEKSEDPSIYLFNKLYISKQFTENKTNINIVTKTLNLKTKQWKITKELYILCVKRKI